MAWSQGVRAYTSPETYVLVSDTLDNSERADSSLFVKERPNLSRACELDSGLPVQGIRI